MSSSPSSSSPDTSGTPLLRVMSINFLAGLSFHKRWTSSLSSSSHLSRTVAQICQHRPDVVCIQGVLNCGVLRELEQAIGPKYEQLVALNDATPGNVLWVFLSLLISILVTIVLVLLFGNNWSLTAAFVCFAGITSVLLWMSYDTGFHAFLTNTVTSGNVIFYNRARLFPNCALCLIHCFNGKKRCNLLPSLFQSRGFACINLFFPRTKNDNLEFAVICGRFGVNRFERSQDLNELSTLLKRRAPETPLILCSNFDSPVEAFSSTTEWTGLFKEKEQVGSQHPETSVIVGQWEGSQWEVASCQIVASNSMLVILRPAAAALELQQQINEASECYYCEDCCNKHSDCHAEN